MVEWIELISAVPALYEIFKNMFVSKTGDNHINAIEKLPSFFSTEVILGLMRAIDAMFEDVDYKLLAKALNELIQKEVQNPVREISPRDAKAVMLKFKKYVYELLLQGQFPSDVFDEISWKPNQHRLKVSIAKGRMQIDICLKDWQTKISYSQK